MVVELFGRLYSRRELAAHCGSAAQFAGVRLMTLGDGVERGIRMLEFRTGAGLRFTVLIERAFDIAQCEYRGVELAWHSPAGFKHPGLLEYEGEGGLAWLRGFSGLTVTCGLDSILFMNREEAAHYHYRPRASVDHSLHGRIHGIPARLTGYGERWEGDECILWAEGIVQQGTVFGEDLSLIRTIEARVGTAEFRIRDRVVNNGFYRTPHMLCYHINLGHPIVAEGARYVAPIAHVPWAAHADDYRRQGVGYRTAPAPQAGFHEQVWEHWMAADSAGLVPVGIVNDALNGGLGFMVETRKDQFPCQYEWQNFQAGQYGWGIEPSTNHVLGKAYAEAQGEQRWLDHGQEATYETRFAVLDGAEAIAAFDRRVAAIRSQPEEDYPAPTGRFDSLTREPAHVG